MSTNVDKVSDLVLAAKNVREVFNPVCGEWKIDEDLDGILFTSKAFYIRIGFNPENERPWRAVTQVKFGEDLFPDSIFKISDSDGVLSNPCLNPESALREVLNTCRGEFQFLIDETEDIKQIFCLQDDEKSPAEPYEGYSVLRSLPKCILDGGDSWPGLSEGSVKPSSVRPKDPIHFLEAKEADQLSSSREGSTWVRHWKVRYPKYPKDGGDCFECLKTNYFEWVKDGRVEKHLRFDFLLKKEAKSFLEWVKNEHRCNRLHLEVWRSNRND